MKLKQTVVAVVIVTHCIAFGVILAASDVSGDGTIKEFDVVARQYAYNPPVIVVDKGDEVHIRLSSLDVIHGFFLEGHDIDAMIEPGKLEFKLRHPSESKEYTPAKEIVFTASRPGKFRYRCSHTCGSLHPFMQGELIVRPNYPFAAAMGGAVGIFLASFAVLFIKAKTPSVEPQMEET